MLSINQLIQQNFKVVFNNYNNSPQAIIYDNKRNRIYKSISDNQNTFKIIISKLQIYFNKNKTNNFYEINYNYLNNNQLIDLWHRCLGHFDISKFQEKLNNINIRSSRKE